MKVIYTKTILDKVLEAIEEARRLGRRIEKIQVTPEEFNSIIRASPLVCSIIWEYVGYKLNGILIEVVAHQPVEAKSIIHSIPLYGTHISTPVYDRASPPPYGRFEGR